MDETAVSFVIPALNEAAYLPATLRSIDDQVSDASVEVLVVDGGSTDATPEIAREHDAVVCEGPGKGIGPARHRGATRAAGSWLAFVDADTVLRPTYLDAMLDFVDEEGLAAASSRCRLTGTIRAKPMEWTINYVFPRLRQPILPGFNLFVAREAYDRVGGFPDVPNEDTAFSRRFARTHPTGYHPEVLVETSARRIVDRGLTGTLVHYLRLDWHRVRASQ